MDAKIALRMIKAAFPEKFSEIIGRLEIAPELNQERENVNQPDQ
ncbi:hypothetical protein ACSAZL_17075 [Methanosarcina sp. T3]